VACLQVKDRRIATLAVLASDATQFTIWTEDKKVLQDILPLVLLARKGVAQLAGYPCELVLAVNAIDVSQASKLKVQNMELLDFFSRSAHDLRKTESPGVSGALASSNKGGFSHEEEPIERFNISQDPTDIESDLVFLGFCRQGEGLDFQVREVQFRLLLALIIVRLFGTANC
jgi:hypothetical protein